MIAPKYSIRYHNDITQIKDMIDQSEYEGVIKPTLQAIYELEVKGSNKSKKEARALKAELKEKYGDNYFTSESPIAKAIKTGILSLPKTQGGDTKCVVKPLTH